MVEVGPEAVEFPGAAIACGSEQFVEVRVREAAHRLAVQTENAGDRAERVAPFTQLVHVGVPLARAGQEPAAGRIGRRRGTDQGGGLRGVGHVVAPFGERVLGVLAQAGPVRVSGPLDGAGRLCRLPRP